ncbi:MAG: efflux RND transporter periplasmic adaptor subunit [Deltaproteobacteria bacterium]|nr:efflux RND transporter periplasmic adaptor subunit [Deltaproteobacteria bacterium]
MKNRKLLIAIIGILVLLVIVVIRIKSTKKNQVKTTVTTLVTVAHPRKVTLKKVIILTGSIMAFRQASIFARVGGYLEKLPVDIGDSVKKGQVLAVINYQDLQDQYQQANASFEYASIQYERAKKLIKKQLIAQNDLDMAKTNFDVTEAAKNLAALNLSYAVIRAPFSGYIASRYVDPGTLIPGSTQMVPANPLLVLVDINTVKIMINIPEHSVAEVHTGMPVTTVTDAYPDKIFNGRITRIAPALDPVTRTMAAEVDIANPRHILKPGMFSKVNIVYEMHKNILAVPVSCVLKTNDHKSIYVVSQGIAKLVSIEEGIESGGMVEVKNGVSISAEIVVQGEDTIHDGQKVEVQQEQAWKGVM